MRAHHHPIIIIVYGTEVGGHESLGVGHGSDFPIVVFMRHRNSIDSIGLAKAIAALSPNDDKKPNYVAEYSALIDLNRPMLLLPIELPTDGTWNAATSINDKREILLHRYIMFWRLLRGHPLGNNVFAGRANVLT